MKMNNNNNEATATEQERDKGGRPSKYQPGTVTCLLKALANGLTLKQACIVSSISETTLSRWRMEHPELVPQLERAREQTRQDALASILKAGEHDWRAKKAFLELSYQEYRQAGTKIDINNQQAQDDIKIVVTPQQRRAMIQARAELLGDAPAIEQGQEPVLNEGKTEPQPE
jgi:hypothetical protein